MDLLSLSSTEPTQPLSNIFLTAMADIGAEYVFPNYAQVDAKLTINGPGRKVVLRPAAELPPFFGKLLLCKYRSQGVLHHHLKLCFALGYSWPHL